MAQLKTFLARSKYRCKTGKTIEKVNFMLEISKTSENRLDIELTGTLNAESMATALDELLEASGDITSGKMLYTVSDFEMPTIGALTVELQYMPKLLGLVGKFNKCAVVSDVAWIRTAAEIEGALIPGLEIKAFPMHARDEAESWLEDMPNKQGEDEENFPV